MPPPMPPPIPPPMPPSISPPMETSGPFTSTPPLGREPSIFTSALGAPAERLASRSGPPTEALAPPPNLGKPIFGILNPKPPPALPSTSASGPLTERSASGVFTLTSALGREASTPALASGRSPPIPPEMPAFPFPFFFIENLGRPKSKPPLPFGFLTFTLAPPDGNEAPPSTPILGPSTSKLASGISTLT